MAGAIFLFPMLVAKPLFGECGGCPNASFGPASRLFNLGAVPSALKTADFNGDGIPDVAVVAGNQVAVLLGRAGGDFAPPTHPAPGVFAQELGIADMDGDGKQDLIVLEQYQVTVFGGLGNGTFGAASSYKLPFYPNTMGVGDLNGDSRPDVLITITNTGFVVLLNDGQGTLGSPRVWGSFATSYNVLLADFNKDTKLDALFPFNGSLLLGNGDGTFAQDLMPVPSAQFQARTLALDVDRDGNMDIVHSDGLRVLHGHSDGTFDPPVAIPTPGYLPGSAASADFNGDSWPDFVVTVSGGGLLLVLSDGLGGFQSPVAYASGFGTAGILAEDMDGDGIPDALVETSVKLALFRGKAGGSLDAAPVLAAPGAVALASEDFNGDTKSDLVAGGNGVSVWLGDGNGGFSSAYSNPAPTQVVAVAAAKLDSGPTMDFVAVSTVGFFPFSGKLWVFLGDGLGGATALPVQDLAYPPTGLQIADIDGDGAPDLVITTIGKGIRILKGAGNGTFTEVGALQPSASFGKPLVKDLGNGKLDIAAPGNGKVSVFLGNGDGSFQPATDYLLSSGASRLLAEDFNNDGKTDIVTGNPVSFLRGRGDGTFEPSFTFPETLGGSDMAAGDFNGDGKMDVAAGSDGAVILAGKGDGSFLTPPGGFGTSGSTQGIIAGDWNKDGKPDLAVAGFGGIAILLNTNCAARRLGVVTEPASCASPGSPLSTQPVVQVLDDGGNIVTCAAGSVSASLVPGTGTAGAQLAGTTTLPLTGGAAAFTDLGVDLEGAFYEIAFQSGPLPPVRSRKFSIHSPYSVSISGVGFFCSFQEGTYSGPPGFDTYVWSLDGNVLGTGPAITLSGLPAGGHALSLRVTKDGCDGEESLPVSVLACPAEPTGLSVDFSPDGAQSDGNGVLEPGERVFVAPFWKNAGSTPLDLTGAASDFGGPPGAAYSLFDSVADYGTIGVGATNNCGDATGNCYELGVSAPETRPATHWDTTVTETLSDGDPATVWRLHIGASFTDVPKAHVFYPYIERLLHNGVTTGCGPSVYCPDNVVFRLQMAVFIARALAGSDELVPATGVIQGNPYVCLKSGVSYFSDVVPEDPFCRHVHYIYSKGVTTGCEPVRYCPAQAVTRAQMALFVARAMAGSDAAVPQTYGPDPATGRSYSCNPSTPNLHFTDVTPSDIFCRHTHYLWAKDVISGFPDNSYGPALDVSRGAMAKFLSNGFGLGLYGP